MRSNSRPGRLKLSLTKGRVEWEILNLIICVRVSFNTDREVLPIFSFGFQSIPKSWFLSDTTFRTLFEI